MWQTVIKSLYAKEWKSSGLKSEAKADVPWPCSFSNGQQGTRTGLLQQIIEKTASALSAYKLNKHFLMGLWSQSTVASLNKNMMFILKNIFPIQVKNKD